MKRKIKITAISILGLALIFFIVLIVHIITAKPIVYDNATMQISRIEFNEPLDSIQMKEIHRNMKSIPGVISDSYNLDKGILVYFHDNRIANSKKIYDTLMSKGNYCAKRYVAPKELASQKICPVMNKGSFGYRLSKEIKRIY